jgi:hypothetical protein
MEVAAQLGQVMETVRGVEIIKNDEPKENCAGLLAQFSFIPVASVGRRYFYEFLEDCLAT